MCSFVVRKNVSTDLGLSLEILKSPGATQKKEKENKNPCHFLMEINIVEHNWHGLLRRFSLAQQFKERRRLKNEDMNTTSPGEGA